MDFPIFDLRLPKRCRQKCASVVFGNLNLFLLTVFIIFGLEGAEHKDWMTSRHACRRAIVSGDISMPSLVEVIGTFVGV